MKTTAGKKDGEWSLGLLGLQEQIVIAWKAWIAQRLGKLLEALTTVYQNQQQCNRKLQAGETKKLVKD